MVSICRNYGIRCSWLRENRLTIIDNSFMRSGLTYDNVNGKCETMAFRLKNWKPSTTPLTMHNDLCAQRFHRLCFFIRCRQTPIANTKSYSYFRIYSIRTKTREKNNNNDRTLVADVVVTTFYSPTQHYLYIFSEMRLCTSTFLYFNLSGHQSTPKYTLGASFSGSVCVCVCVGDR